jgi:hypothetical protein
MQFAMWGWEAGDIILGFRVAVFFTPLFPQSRIRKIMQMPSSIGNSCPSSDQKRMCNTAECGAKDCKVELWDGWSPCTLSCGGGEMTRTRTINHQPELGGKPCPSLSENKQCSTQLCVVDCQVSKWGDWSVCSQRTGEKTRLRDVQVEPLNGGRNCASVTEAKPCPVDCHVGAWSPWSGCESYGAKQRSRTVRIPAR